MSLFCSAPNTSTGVAIRLSDFLDCQARALGENGFQAIAGGPLGMSILSGLLTIFIGLIGYRLILGEIPGLRHGINWAVRLGFVLALVTSWPAFQTLVFRVVADGPVELAGIVLPASGLPSEGLDWRVQQAYDTMRLGSAFQFGQAQANRPQQNSDQSGQVQQQGQPPNAQNSALPPPLQFQPPMPQTASLFVLSTAGFTGAFRIAVGFLLAVGPLAIMALLFDATLGLFAGWLRALTGMAFASLASAIVTAIGLMVVESELAHLQALRFGGSIRSMDPQGLTTIVIVLALVTLVTSLAAMRMTGALRLSRPVPLRQSDSDRTQALNSQPAVAALRPAQELVAARIQTLTQTRVAGVAEALAATVRREQAYLIDGSSMNGSAHGRSNEATAGGSALGSSGGLGTTGRRSLGRRTRSAARRDKSG